MKRKTRKAAAKKAAPKKRIAAAKKAAVKKAAPKKRKAAAKKAAAKHLEKDFKNLTLVEMNAKEMAIVCNALALSSEPGAKQLLSDFKKQKIK